MGYEHSGFAKGDGMWINYLQGAETVPAYSLVYANTNGQWALADADAAATMPVVGLATEPLRANQKGRVVMNGFVNNTAWSWTAGSLLYASGTAGGLTHTAPSSNVQEVGIAFSSTLIYFSGNGFGSVGNNTLFIPYAAKIADIAETDTNVHYLDLQTALSETRTVIATSLMARRISGTGIFQFYANDGTDLLQSGTNFRYNFFLSHANNRLKYNQTVANDDWDLFCYGYVVQF